MNVMRRLAVGALVLLAFPWGTARAGHGFFSIGIGLGVPVYRPWYGCPYYYAPYPVVVAPAPVVVQPAPVVQQVPVVQPVYPAPAATLPATPVPVVAHASQVVDREAEVERNLQLLSAADERVRAEAALQLGRRRARRAADRLETVLTTDGSPEVREAAARALGLIGAPHSLAALRRAAQADGDRDVRTSARFAVDVVQAGGVR
jgi:hypothetical protein